MARLLVAGVALGLAATGCAPRQYRAEADAAAYSIIQTERVAALGKVEEFSIERPSATLRRVLLEGQSLPTSGPAAVHASLVQPIPQWPDAEYLASDPAAPLPLDPARVGALVLSLDEALQVGARNSREYQSQKESVFQTALRLDLARNEFRTLFDGGLEGELTRDLGVSPQSSGVRGTAAAGLSRQFRNGVGFAASLGVDLARLLTQDRSSSLGLFGDATVSIPLLRGSGRFIVTEPLQQAERDVIYAIYQFERFKRDFAVRIATDYLGVLRQLDQVRNAEENYRGLVISTRRANRLAAAGRLPEIQVDQSRQDELSARNRWITSQQTYERVLDRFKTLLGIPTDAALALDGDELSKLENLLVLTELELAGADADPAAVQAADDEVMLVPPTDADAGPFELAEATALRVALDSRLDLRIAVGRVADAQRTVAVSADNLRADLTLLGSGSAGSGRSIGQSTLDDTGLRPERGRYSAFLNLDLPFERTAERNLYRNSLIAFEQAVRAVQDLEDEIKLQVREDLRSLLEARETLRIQGQAVRIADRRVASTDLFLRAGRAETRDLLEAQEALNTARNALTAARVQYRVSELELQRDLDILEVDAQGLWREFRPETRTP